jgi:uncharacterized protein (DUF924 family)
MEECLALWFGKSEEIDREIWERFGTDVGLASRGHCDHWALSVEHPRLLVALVIMLDQFRRNLYRDTPGMYPATLAPWRGDPAGARRAAALSRA